MVKKFGCTDQYSPSDLFYNPLGKVYIQSPIWFDRITEQLFILTLWKAQEDLLIYYDSKPSALDTGIEKRIHSSEGEMKFDWILPKFTVCNARDSPSGTDCSDRLRIVAV
ncbi:hypothetical protein FGIG_05252 [Fasciola gigantica]|uniref:Uncharacterized protein n=1 Tax=Fasciola gigantica TaxID=46835 RepID=A0A504Z649_FASGI|nr:hypothetical protein FGIG_05252 [Fasciola gigantica]